MEVKIIEQSKKKIMFELVGEDHTFSNALKDALKKNKHVEVVSFNVDHPLISSPVFIVETDGEDPKKVLLESTKKLQKDISDLRKEVEKIKV